MDQEPKVVEDLHNTTDSDRASGDYRTSPVTVDDKRSSVLKGALRMLDVHARKGALRMLDVRITKEGGVTDARWITCPQGVLHSMDQEP